MELTRHLNTRLLPPVSLGIAIADNDMGKDGLRADKRTRKLLIELQHALALEKRRSGLLIKAGEYLAALEGHSASCDRRYDQTRDSLCTCEHASAEADFHDAKLNRLPRVSDTQRGGLLS
jgi:hypothetical protein